MIMANFHIQESFNRVAAVMALLKWAKQEMTKENSSVILAAKEQQWWRCEQASGLSESEAPSGV